MHYLVVLDGSGPEAGYSVKVPDLPGCLTEGDTMAEALRNAAEAVECHLEGMLMDGEQAPQPSVHVEVGAGQLVGSCT